MVWTLKADERREDTQENATHKMERKRPRGRPRTRWIDQIRKNIAMRRENWEETQENKKMENSDGQ